MTNSKNNWFYKAIVLSVLFHIILLFAAGWVIENPWFVATDASNSKDVAKDPLVFEFEQPEVVETPESARTEKPSEQPRYLSDKTARAQNNMSPKDLPLGEAYSDGMQETPQAAEIPSQPQPAALPEKPAAQSEEKDISYQQMDPSSFSRKFLTQSPTQKSDTYGEVFREKSRNRKSRAPDMGDFSINTYEWDFAPYMIRLKRRIEKNIFPPPAFTYMGIISGQTVLRFRITPEGKLAKLEVLYSNGHKSLLNTSMKAVEVSAPFEPLPGNFPEKYLEVTGRFDYITNR